MLVTCVLAIATIAGSAAAEQAAMADPCCFTNPRYTGVCQQVPQEDETCGDILRYLNNPNSTGKAYCGNTSIRGGWAQVECEEDETAGVGVCVDEGPAAVQRRPPPSEPSS